MSLLLPQRRHLCRAVHTKIVQASCTVQVGNLPAATPPVCMPSPARLPANAAPPVDTGGFALRKHSIVGTSSLFAATADERLQTMAAELDYISNNL